MNDSRARHPARKAGIKPLLVRNFPWLFAAISITGLVSAPALAAPPEWARKKPATPSTTQVETTTTTPTTTTTTTQPAPTTEPTTTTTLGGVVCTASGECGEWVSEAPIVCYNALGEIVAVLDSYDYDNPALNDPSLYCSSGY